MTSPSWVLAAGYVAVVAGFAVGSQVWVSSDPGWYDALDRPSFQPPDLVFGIIWPLNFVALLAVGVGVAVTQPTRTSATALGLLVIAVVFSLAWAYLFYGPHALVAAAWCLLASTVATWWMVAYLAVWAGPAWGAGLLVFAGWLTVATALAFGYATLN